MIDTHCHLDEESFETDRGEVVARGEAAGLVAIVTIGTTVESSRRAIELSRDFRMVHAAVGLHPNYLTVINESAWEEIERLAAEPEVVAIGETGIDLYWKTTPLNLQVDYFRRHIDLSRREGKPFVVHCRDSEAEVMSVLAGAAKNGPLQGIMHSFTLSAERARQCVEWGMMISFAGMVTYNKNEELRRTAGQIPLERILIETDAPYLAPVPYRGKRNEPGWVMHTAKTIAQVRGVEFAEFWRQAGQNAREYLKIPG